MSVKLKQSFFKSIKKQTDSSLKLNLNGKRLYATNSVKYLDIKIYENLNCHEQVDNVAIKLNIANALISKVRHFVDKKNFENNISSNI